jgi:hypothetical protein
LDLSVFTSTLSPILASSFLAFTCKRVGKDLTQINQKCVCMYACMYVFMALGKSRTSQMLEKCSTTKLYSQLLRAFRSQPLAELRPNNKLNLAAII